MDGTLEFNGFKDYSINATFASSKNIVDSLSNEKVKLIVMSLGADRCELHLTHYIFPTICHNTDGEEASMKLYYYFNNRMFICYTLCNCAFNILGLIVKVKQLNENDKYSYQDARDYILNFIEGILINILKKYLSKLLKYKRKISASELPSYNENRLKVYPQIIHNSWIEDGITSLIAKEFDIRFSIDNNAIIIPHRDIDGRLIGIRVRNLNASEDNDIPKYCPLITKEKTYSHPLSLNLYGLNLNKKEIANCKHAILFEGLKSVLLHKLYYGELSNAAAVCGSSLSKPQVDILIKKLGVNHITVALDKLYIEYNSLKANKYFNKLYLMCEKYSKYANFDFIFDSNGLLSEKDSPVDKGKEIWESLYLNRVIVKG